MKRIILIFISLTILLISFTAATENKTSLTETTDYTVEIPSNWKEISKGTFSPFSASEDTSKTILHIVVKPSKTSSLSNKEKRVLISQKIKTGDKIISQDIRKIRNIKTFDLLLENNVYGATRKVHETFFIKNNKLYVISLTASPALFIEADKIYNRAIKTFKPL